MARKKKRRETHDLRIVLTSQSRWWTCEFCGTLSEAWRPGETHDKPHAKSVDHLYPRSMGGANEYANLLAACRTCNGLKQELESKTDWRKMLHIARRLWLRARKRRRERGPQWMARHPEAAPETKPVDGWQLPADADTVWDGLDLVAQYSQKREIKKILSAM